MTYFIKFDCFKASNDIVTNFYIVYESFNFLYGNTGLSIDQGILNVGALTGALVN